MPRTRQHPFRRTWSQLFAAWIFPVDLEGRQEESWGQWTNWRIFLLLLLAPVLLIAAFTARDAAWWERGLMGAVGAVAAAGLGAAVVGYRQLTARARAGGGE